MQQLFNTRNYSIRDFEEWRERQELVLTSHDDLGMTMSLNRVEMGC